MYFFRPHKVFDYNISINQNIIVYVFSQFQKIITIIDHINMAGRHAHLIWCWDKNESYTSKSMDGFFSPPKELQHYDILNLFEKWAHL